MNFHRLSIAEHPLFSQFNKAWLADETEHVHRLLAAVDLQEDQRHRICDHARELVTHVRHGCTPGHAIQH